MARRIGRKGKKKRGRSRNTAGSLVLHQAQSLLVQARILNSVKDGLLLWESWSAGEGSAAKRLAGIISRFAA